MPVPRATVCLICGKSSLGIICDWCARRITSEALRNEIQSETHGKLPRVRRQV